MHQQDMSLAREGLPVKRVKSQLVNSLAYHLLIGSYICKSAKGKALNQVILRLEGKWTKLAME